MSFAELRARTREVERRGQEAEARKREAEKELWLRQGEINTVEYGAEQIAYAARALADAKIDPKVGDGCDVPAVFGSDYLIPPNRGYEPVAAMYASSSAIVQRLDALNDSVRELIAALRERKS